MRDHVPALVCGRGRPGAPAAKVRGVLDELEGLGARYAAGGRLRADLVVAVQIGLVAAGRLAGAIDLQPERVDLACREADAGRNRHRAGGARVVGAGDGRQRRGRAGMGSGAGEADDPRRGDGRHVVQGDRVLILVARDGSRRGRRLAGDVVALDQRPVGARVRRRLVADPPPVLRPARAGARLGAGRRGRDVPQSAICGARVRDRIPAFVRGRRRPGARPAQVSGSRDRGGDFGVARDRRRDARDRVWIVVPCQVERID